MAKRNPEKSTTPIVSTEIAAEPTLSSTTPSTSDEASAIELPDFLKQFTRPVMTEEQIHKATEAFESRLDELTELHNELSDRTLASRLFKTAPESYSKAARLIHDTLNRTLGYGTMDLSPNRASSITLFRRCADCLHSLNNVLSVLDFRDLSEQFQNLLRCLNNAQELEQMGYDYDLEQLETSIWEDCLPELLQEIEVITSRLQMSIEPSDGQDLSKGVETVSWKGATFQIDYAQKRLARTHGPKELCSVVSFKKNLTPHQWSVAVAFLKSEGADVDVAKIVKKTEPVYCRDIVRKVRSAIEEFGVSLQKVKGKTRTWRLVENQA